MDRLLTVYVKPDYVSVSVQNGVNRTVAGTNITEVIAGLHPQDLAALKSFCLTVLSEAKAQLPQ